MRTITITVNGLSREATVEDNELLLNVLRDKLGVTSVKAACWRGECGLCTVLLNGLPVKSCMTLAVEADGKEVVTAEGLYSDERARKLQESFVEHGAMQCGFCTPAFVVTSHYVLSRDPEIDGEDLKRELSGVICRCGTYYQIYDAVRDARKYYKDKNL
ncbi:MAG: (2Fe-2S)-binding protein [Nitrososphaerota archaeon]|jgi:aerobic-type carbon monoxide dehydrogenase small subunit (CoxS/CutS family)|nr:(2Fe-2S)-binding protein [Nitrososphaerota archaeon]MDG6927987.1 (2Fe-2S)-binding protein [Nitrososphaerota archaeon]MDG6932835.1 (2Fe-2S)-binding protein [Nitrososphaerota archaeon]MDG6936842.1 (2Fe-2S)-binding protein [Nitrososphaerota archaeon]MDG6945041.1 (2Fe-2S)-binding protein [Nitrososphaerota archaeon]